ncbi:MBL fold metallo-hydrolase [Gordonia sp. SID5947]|uniref:MBL fold metallo-hydrolase n=1 Tax=Gordonia sp. SID5947 TaxID=2690315 RepID=UPI00136D0A1D|nr:MBL fold metallo-hydrolase [Gordonia sp. SID5947]MYR06680.1 MBL fold metallo-hydrolase [Gordonia sp. SID5947]
MTTIEVTGHRQREAWAEKVMPPVEEVRPGLWSIPVPMWSNPLRYVLIYALALPDGLALIDTGWTADDSWQALVAGIHATGHDVSEVRHVSITHLHPDHFGLVPRLLEHADPVLAMHHNDARHLRFRTDDEIDRQIAESHRDLEMLGAPTDVADTGFREIARLPAGRTMDIELTDGDALNLPGWNLRALWTPGHTAGHLCFADEDAGVIFTGDHLLPRISPNVSTNPFQSHSPLADYLVSLAHTENLPDLEALPSHEYRFRGLSDRVTALLGHHEERLAEITAAVVANPESTAWEITRSVTWSRPFESLSVDLGRMALRETNAHLVVLEQRGVLTPTEGIPIRWSLSDVRTSNTPTTEESPR